jgi:hypothetical protein
VKLTRGGFCRRSGGESRFDGSWTSLDTPFSKALVPLRTSILGMPDFPGSSAVSRILTHRAMAAVIFRNHLADRITGRLLAPA